MKLKFLALSFLCLAVSCKLFNKQQSAKTNATLTSGARKKGVFPLAVEQIGITDSTLKELGKKYQNKDFSGDMVLETVVWMEAYGNEVSVEFENPDKNFTRTEIEKISNNTQVCLYKSQVMRRMHDVVVEQEFNISKVDEILKTPINNINIEKPEADASPEEIEFYKQNKAEWLQAKQLRNSMVQTYKKTLGSISHERQKQFAPLAYYGKMRSLDHFHKSQAPITNLFSDHQLNEDKDKQATYNIRAIPFNYLTEAFVNEIYKTDQVNQMQILFYGGAKNIMRGIGIAALAGGALLSGGTLLVPIVTAAAGAAAAAGAGAGVASAASLAAAAATGAGGATLGVSGFALTAGSESITKDEIRHAVNYAAMTQSINKKICQLKNRKNNMVPIEPGQSFAVLGGAYSPLGFYTMAFLRDYPKDILVGNIESKKYNNYYYNYLLNSKNPPSNKDTNSLIKLLQKIEIKSDIGSPIVGGDFYAETFKITDVIDNNPSASIPPTATGILKKYVQVQNLNAIERFKNSGQWDSPICNPLDVEFMCL